MSRAHNSIPKLAVCLIGLTMASAAMAQAPRSSLDISASAGAPEFRDPKTGHVWTPETVSQDGRPLTGPEDKAFNPEAQNVPAKSVEQRIRGRPVGTVPVTAGPTVPIVVMDSPSLRAVPGQRWQAVVYLDNNSSNPVDPVIECRFSNAGNAVMDARAIVQTTAPSVRQALVVYGPRTDVFVDRANCHVTAP